MVNIDLPGFQRLCLCTAPAASNPVLTRGDVNDVPALFVADPFILESDGKWHMYFECI
jgi:hypothetical protein